MAALLVNFLLFYLYLILIPIGISPFETPKVIVAEIVIDTILLIKILRLKKLQWKGLFSSQLIFIGLLFILSLDTQLLFHPQGAFFGNIFRLQGQFLFWHLLLFSLISEDIKIDQNPKFLYYLSFICFFFGTIILGVNENNRAFGTLGEPNALATTALFILPFIWFYSKKLYRIVWLIGSLIIILLSGSRAGLIGLIIEVLFIFLISKLKISHLKAVTICILIILSTLILPFIDNKGWFENRADIWQTSFNGGLESPLIGHGFGNIQNIIHQSAGRLNNNVMYQVVDSSHNFLLDYWLEGGIVGVVCILFLIGLSIHGLILTKRTLELTAFLGVITAMLFNPVSVVNLLAFWWLIGQGLTKKTR